MASSNDLRRALQVGGLSSAADLGRAIQASQPVVSRLVRSLGREILRIGAARSTRYALKRSFKGQAAEQPLYRIAEDGSGQHIGTLTVFHGGTHFASVGAPELYRADLATQQHMYEELPWFLYDMRPQGYLGRLLARELSARFGTPLDPREWNMDDVLQYLVAAGADLPGDLVLGESAMQAALRRIQKPPDIIMHHEKARIYVNRVRQLRQGEVVGSSAAGEQPKFTATVQESDGTVRHVIVKFVDDPEQAAGRRWVDLLRLEHAASEIMRRNNMQTATTRLGSADGVYFLEVDRFDRTQQGRRSMVSLEALGDGIVDDIGPQHTWNHAAQALLSSGLISEDDAVELRRRYWFGVLTHNTDMHRGNTSFHVENALLRLAPSYDMVPMAFRPTEQGSIVERRLDTPIPLRQDEDIVASVMDAATELNELRKDLLSGG